MEHNYPAFQDEPNDTDYSTLQKNQFDFSKVNKDDYLTRPNQEQLHRYETLEDDLSNIHKILSSVKDHQKEQDSISANEKKLEQCRQVVYEFLRHHCPIVSCTSRNKFRPFAVYCG